MHDISFQILEKGDKCLELNVNIFCRSNLCKYNSKTRGIKALSFRRHPYHLEYCIPTLIKLKACCIVCAVCVIIFKVKTEKDVYMTCMDVR